MAPTVSSSDASELSTDNAAFAMDLYAKVATDDSSNLFYSPYSISLALAMTYNGANGETAQQMAQALHFTLPVDQLNAAFDSVDLALATRQFAKDDQGNAAQGLKLNVADSLWTDKTLSLQQPFVDALGVNYGAGVRVVDFIHAADAAVDAINGWVSEETNAKIPNLLSPSDVDDTTRLVLVNAIYFDAAWATPFETSATHAEPFTKIDGSTTTSTAMSESLDSAGYASGSGWQAVELPYVGNQTSMVVVLPDSGQFATVEQGLSGAFFQSVTSSLASTSVQMTLPKFQIHGATISLKQTLEALGMIDAFSNTADFSKMANQPLYVGDVLHQAFVDVDESGTEAAAATAVVMKLGAIAQQPIAVDVNRPFVFFIRDIPTNTILFVGRVVDPG